MAEQCAHVTQHQVPETYKIYGERCTRRPKVDMEVCWQHTPEKVAEQAKRAHDRETRSLH